jgi:hypothetical protein
MPARIDENERPVIVSYTLLPSQKEFLEKRAQALSYTHGQHISASTLIRYMIDSYRNTVENQAAASIEYESSSQAR